MSDPIEDFLLQAFDDNLRRLQLEGGHTLTREVYEAARWQVLLYWRRLRPVAEKVTDTEVRLTLPNQVTPQGRRFGIEGVVDIVREHGRTTLYDLKTHEAEIVRANPENYQKQLNVYAHVWQGLRGQPLDETAIICTTFPDAVREAVRATDEATLAAELARWDPIIPIPFSQTQVDDTIADFGRVVDAIESRQFAPPSQAALRTRWPGAPTMFAVHTCRNCDARFSCPAYRQFTLGNRHLDHTEMRRFFAATAPEDERADWLTANLPTATTLTNPDDFAP